VTQYDDLVNDYLRAVEQALADVPADRREELLTDLSEHIAAKRAELGPANETEVEVRTILELLGTPSDLAAEAHAALDDPPPPPVLIQPKKKSAAVIWVLITIAAVATMCVAAVLLGVVFFAATENSSDPAVPATPTSWPSTPTTTPS
jgi:uncharacterized membrane protein